MTTKMTGGSSSSNPKLLSIAYVIGVLILLACFGATTYVVADSYRKMNEAIIEKNRRTQREFDHVFQED